ncbi:MAG: PKD domain-containing protein, partial [Thermoplasmata archaeon]|nr:PKD domain-containing protein [Thermoplasmata archaeon]
VYFDGSGSYDPDNDPIQYNWDFGDDTTTGWQNLSGVSHTYNQAGNYTVTLTVRDTIHPPFLMDNDTCIVKVTDPSSSNNPPVADAGSDQNANISQTVYFDGSGSYDPDNDPLTYNWDFGDGTSTNWQNNCNSSHAYNATGNYTVTLTVSDGVLNDDDICIVSVKSSWSGSTNNPPIADAGPDQTVKVGQIVNFDGSGSYDPDGDPLLYLWEFGDMPMPSWFNSSFRVHSYAQPGIYTATLSVSDGEFTDHDNCTIYVIDEDSGEKPDKVNDTDGDGLPDDWELEHGFDPNDSNDAELDPDGDTLTNLDEFEQGTDPHNKDTDGDDIPDNWELENGLNPTDGTDAVLDPDGDSLSNLREFQQSTNPQDKDTDGDGYPDNIDAYPTNPNKYKEEITDNKALIETYAIILILIIIIVIIIVMMAVLYKNKRKISGQISTDDRQEIRDSYMAEEFQPPESSDLESDGLIKNLKQEALVPDKPNVFGLTEQEILEKIDIKYRNGELSKTTYDSIRETIGTFKP